MKIFVCTRINRLQFVILYFISIFCLYIGNMMLNQNSEFPEITAKLCLIFGIALYTLALIFRANDIGYDNRTKLVFWLLSGIPLFGVIAVGALIYLPSDNSADVKQELQCSNDVLKLNMKFRKLFHSQNLEDNSTYGEALYSFCTQYKEILYIIQKYKISKDEFQKRIRYLEHNAISWQGDIYLPLIVTSCPRLLTIMCTYPDCGVSYLKTYFSNTKISDGRNCVFNESKVSKQKICALIFCLLSIVSLTMFVPYKVDSSVKKHNNISEHVMYGTIINVPERIIEAGAARYAQIDYGRILLDEGIIVVLVAAGYFGSSMIKNEVIVCFVINVGIN